MIASFLSRLPADPFPWEQMAPQTPLAQPLPQLSTRATPGSSATVVLLPWGNSCLCLGLWGQADPPKATAVLNRNRKPHNRLKTTPIFSVYWTSGVSWAGRCTGKQELGLWDRANEARKTCFPPAKKTEAKALPVGLHFESCRTSSLLINGSGISVGS